MSDMRHRTPAKAPSSSQSGEQKPSKGGKTVAPAKNPSILGHLVLPLAFAPVMLFALLFLAKNYCTIWFESTEERPCFLTLPYIGGSLGPFAIGLSLYLYRLPALNFLPKFLRKLLFYVPLFLLLLHNFFTVFYGNINNDAWSDSLMIDVVGPPGTFNQFKRLIPEVVQTYDATAWAHEALIDGPHLDINATRTATCGPRGFARFMYHRITPQARVHAILGEGVMFGGIWLMVQGTSGAR